MCVFTVFQDEIGHPPEHICRALARTSGVNAYNSVDGSMLPMRRCPGLGDFQLYRPDKGRGVNLTVSVGDREGGVPRVYQAIVGVLGRTADSTCARFGFFGAHPPPLVLPCLCFFLSFASSSFGSLFHQAAISHSTTGRIRRRRGRIPTRCRCRAAASQAQSKSGRFVSKSSTGLLISKAKAQDPAVRAGPLPCYHAQILVMNYLQDQRAQETIVAIPSNQALPANQPIRHNYILHQERD